MRKLYAFLALLIFSQTYAQINRETLKNFDTSGMETDFLVPSSPVVNLLDLNQTTINTYDFFQAYKGLTQGDLDQQLSSLDLLKEAKTQSYFDGIIPIALVHSEYESITENAFQNHWIRTDSQGYLIRRNVENPVFEKNQLTIVAPLRTETKGLETTFKLDTSILFNTTATSIIDLYADFDDDNGFIHVEFNTEILVQYPDIGNKTLTFEIHLSNGEILRRSATITIKYSNADLYNQFNRVVTTFNSSIAPDLSAYNGEPANVGTGEYEIVLSADGILDKPIILVDGFDPEDGRDITGLRELLNFDDGGTISNLETIVTAEGFDVVYLNFPVYSRASDGAVIDGGVDFIERNAMLLVELLNRINADKIGSEQNVIIGPSMGGLISRYALNYMESQESLDHDTRLWISFDAPHHGANVPIGFQHQFNFLAFGLDDFWILGDQNVEELQPIINGMLKSATDA